jgi:hypothetical protein
MLLIYNLDNVTVQINYYFYFLFQILFELLIFINILLNCITIL